MADDPNDVLAALKEQMLAFSKQMEEAKRDLAPIQDELVKINSAKHQLQQEFQIQMDKIRHQESEYKAQLNKVEMSVATVQQAFNNAEYQAKKIQEEIERKKAEALAKQAEAEQFAMLNERFDLATKGAPWREWAKDHQIAAGHKLTADRYVILADPMGLGKTLSSIITADMVEAITKEASPEWPFLGEEQDVYVPDRWVWTDKAIKAALNNEWPFENHDYVRVVNIDGEDQPEWLQQPMVAGEIVKGYLPYDTKNRWVEAGIVEHQKAHTEKQIVNSITRPVGRKILYFCPSPLLRNVLEEWRNWAPHRNVTYIGNMSKAERNFVLDLTLPNLKEYVIIINYEAWRRDKALLDKLASCKFDTVIIDEAHMVKDMKSQAYKGVQKIVDECKPEYVIPMTGTPILNRPQEIYPLLHLVNPREFNDQRDFLWRYCEEYLPEGSTNPKWKFKPGGLDLLAKKMRKNFLRRTKDEAGIQLPEKTIIYHELDLDKTTYAAQAKAREHMKKYATIVIDEKAGKALQATVMIALITRLRQIETWPAGIIQRDKNTKEVILQLDVEESQKIDYIIRKENDEWEGLIPDTVEDERIVVFSQFKAPLHELKRRVEAAGYRAVILDGDTSSDLRDEIRHDFDRSVTPDRANSKWDVLLANYKAAGVGLNLTNATQLITLDEEWNPGKREQAWDRIHRIGQTQNVTINVVRTKDTIDTWLANIIDDKTNIVGGFEQAMMDVDDFKKFLEGDSGLA